MLTLEEIKDKYPKIYQAIFDEGKNAGYDEGHTNGVKEAEVVGFEEGKAEGIKEGAETERKRIQEVEAQLLPGHETLIEDLKYDGKTTGGEAAVQILQAENVLRTSVKDKLDADSPEPVVPAIPPETEGEKGEDANLPMKDKAKAKWEADAELRSEFLNDFDTYLAYLKADENGSVRILKGKSEK